MNETLTAYEELILFSIEFLTRIVVKPELGLQQGEPSYDFINKNDN